MAVTETYDGLDTAECYGMDAILEARPSCFV